MKSEAASSRDHNFSSTASNPNRGGRSTSATAFRTPPADTNPSRAAVTGAAQAGTGAAGITAHPPALAAATA